jgi:uncharacterized protein YidB (DUF937 family)
MGLLDSLAGEMLGPLSGVNDERHNGLMEAIGGLITNQGSDGLADLVGLFEQKGFGDVVASWVHQGPNLPISARELESVLGTEQIQGIAHKLGLPPEEVSAQMAELLPQVVDKLTPTGTVPEWGALGGLLGTLE